MAQDGSEAVGGYLFPHLDAAMAVVSRKRRAHGGVLRHETNAACIPLATQTPGGSMGTGRQHPFH